MKDLPTGKKLSIFDLEHRLKNITDSGRRLLVIVLFGFLAACGGGGGSDPSPKADPQAIEGQILDSYIEGLSYETNTQIGTTDVEGTFYYLPGETVSFYVGDILIGSSLGKSIVTPFDFAPGSKNIEDPIVGNILRFLITLDDNNNPDDGITILPSVATLATGLSLDFTMTSGFDAATSTVLSTITGGVKTSLVAYSAVEMHFANSLYAFLASEYSGTYTSSSDSGTWAITVVSNGNISGTFTSSSNSTPINLVGTLYDNASFVLNSNNSVTFSGRFDYLGGVSGTWTDGVVTGTFTSQETGGGSGSDGEPVGGSLEFEGADIGKQLFNLSNVLTENLGTEITYYVFNNDPPGFPEVFTPNYDVLTFVVIVDNSTGEVAAIEFGYFNTGSNVMEIPNAYNYFLVCEPGVIDECDSVQFSAANKSVVFVDTEFQPDSSSDLPNFATSTVTANGALNW